ncbi:alpha-(1-_6)-mannopyranosyltransferase A [Corynebacterium suicordis]|uniref:Alpha-(1->6)-mannopyranosyltransferase A n=1 Tax=Corynebacterium suicordis DSM 45110 TaxID=1121369 RepID=A0ABR9ZK63_9CORY|nr:alpha-(1->6)-mannopyranosyltransferase A [Corynebacterium suicordis]MBF4553821.1 alpha-(1->6)-mannopyranosyltransferase A [Corynebacterium suicordis DSM 45110]MDR6277202.1 alpha-1,6-mannosyltransferase [Corynebacterium suicordis]
MSTFTMRLRALTWRHAIILGLIGSIILALSSHAAGAVRARGGVLHIMNLTSLTFGHFTGIMVVIMWIGVGLLLLSWMVAGGHILRHGHSLDAPMVFAWIAPLMFAGPMMSRDLYSYLMQGTLARDGINPYEHGAAANPGPILFEVSSDWRNTTTPYGPLHLWISELITTITGDNITAGTVVFKIVSVASIAGMIWSVNRLARYVGTRPSVAVWLGVANPLVIIHLIGGMHNENIMMALVLLGLVLSLRLRPLPGFLAGTVLIALAVSLKVTAFIALPFLVWIFVARWAGPGPVALFRESWKRLGTLMLSGIAALAITGGVIQAVTLLSGQTWGWIAEMAGNTKVINPLALPSLLASTLEPTLTRLVDDDLTFNVLVSAIRPFTTALMVLGLAVVWWMYRRDEMQALKGASLAYLVTCIFNSVTLPWYYAAVLALLAVWATDRRIIFIAAWLSATLCFMFDGGGNNRLYNLWWVLLIGAVMWWALRGATGYSPLRKPHQTDSWVLNEARVLGETQTPAPAPAQAQALKR